MHSSTNIFIKKKGPCGCNSQISKFLTRCRGRIVADSENKPAHETNVLQGVLGNDSES